MIRLSIIIPVYNKESYLEKCLNSVVCQTAKDIELILIDDGSQDGSGKICDKYAAKYPWIRVFHQENKGVSSARNCGIKNAQGKYIGFVDADDIIDSSMYEQLLSIAEKESLDVVFCDLLVSVQGKRRQDEFKHIQKNSFFSCDKLEPVNLFEMSIFVVKGIFLKEIVVDNNICFEENIKLSEDRMFLIEFLGTAKTGYYLGETLYFYEMNQAGAVLRYYPNKLEMLLHNKLLIEKKLKKYWTKEHVDYYYAEYAWSMVEVLKSYFHKECPYSITEKYKKVKMLVHNEMVCDIFEKADKTYWLYRLFYKKRVLLLCCLGYIKMKFF